MVCITLASYFALQSKETDVEQLVTYNDSYEPNNYVGYRDMERTF